MEALIQQWAGSAVTGVLVNVRTGILDDVRELQADIVFRVGVVSVGAWGLSGVKRYAPERWEPDLLLESNRPWTTPDEDPDQMGRKFRR